MFSEDKALVASGNLTFVLFLEEMRGYLSLREGYIEVMFTDLSCVLVQMHVKVLLATKGLLAVAMGAPVGSADCLRLRKLRIGRHAGNHVWVDLRAIRGWLAGFLIGMWSTESRDTLAQVGDG